MKQIAILSDTHGLLREPVIAELTKADCSIHAGDINTPYIAESMMRWQTCCLESPSHGGPGNGTYDKANRESML
jgi:hypothetical protein